MPNKNLIQLIHSSLAFFWIYQGLIPKLLFISPEEIAVWQWLGLSEPYARLAGQASGIGEIIFGLCFIFIRHRFLHYVNILGLIGLFLLISLVMPTTLISAFNPVVMNGAMIMLSVIYLSLIKTNHS